MPKATRGGRSANNQNTGLRNYTAFSDQDAQNLRDIQDSAYNGSVTAAVKMYISGQPGTPAANVDGQGHSLSQTLNYLLEQGYDVNNMTAAQVNQAIGVRIDGRTLASMQYSDAYMAAGAHAIGKDTLLTRAAHATVLQQEFGLSNWNNMTEAQLKARLVGATTTNKAYLSTSYDASKSPFLSSSSGIAGGREVIYRIKTPSSTKVLLGNKAQAEVIIAKGQNMRITDAGFTGKTATPRLGGATRQIYVDIEIY